VTTIFAILGLAFAGFCVWLAIRIVNRRERWAKRTAAVVLVVMLAVYPLSIGPACWLSSHLDCGASAVTVVYRPLLLFVPNAARGTLMKYSIVASGPKWSWEHRAERRDIVPTTPAGYFYIYWDRDL
jgi:hypothetical protein